jgi:hypothetical protein
MPSGHPRGIETHSKTFDVEPSYATGDDSVILFMRPPGFEADVYNLSRVEAEGLRDALAKVCGKVKSG